MNYVEIHKNVLFLWQNSWLLVILKDQPNKGCESFLLKGRQYLSGFTISPHIPFIYFCSFWFLGGIRNWTYDLILARHALCFWAISPPHIPFKNSFLLHHILQRSKLWILRLPFINSCIHLNIVVCKVVSFLYWELKSSILKGFDKPYIKVSSINLQV